jgi:hypothetical protein
MERLAERPVWSMSGSEMLSALDRLQADLNRINTYRLELLAALDANGHATEIGARNTVQLIAIRHRLDPTDVRRDLKLAKALPKYEAVNTALHTEPAADSDAGTDAGPLVHPGQAEAIVDALERVPAAANVSVETLRVTEKEMVKAAQVLPPGELRKLGKRVRDTLDTDGPEPAEKRAHAKETLWLKRRDDGIQFGGFLAADNAELLQTVIFAGAKPHKTPDGRPDPRTRGKRQADGLVAGLTVAAGTGTAVPGHGGIKPHITVTINLDNLLAGTGTGDLAHGGTLSAAAIRRLACDAGIIPLVLGANSEPLDVGTEERFVNRAMRRALNTRDKGCIVCGAPPAMCEAHHIVHWANGGPTRVENLVLLCKAHHIDVHHGHWTITMVNSQPRLSRPGWADRPPGPNPPPDTWATSPPGTRPPAPSTAPPDTGVAPPDTGVAPPDTGVAPPDTGVAAPDTGVEPPDATRPAPGRTSIQAPGPTGHADGGAAHPLGNAARSLGNTWADQLRRDVADYPDPWADHSPTPTAVRPAADSQPVTPRADSPPATPVR